MFQTLTRTVVGTAGTALCAGLCLIGATAPAKADTVATTRSQAVSYADLDLASDAGRAMLDRRIINAARSVCSTGSSELAARVAEVRCVRGAVEAAQPKLLAALDATRAG